MRKIKSKGSIVVLLGLFLLAAYLEGISIEPIERLNSLDLPESTTQNSGFPGGGLAKSADQDSASKGYKSHRSASFQADEQKHKALDHSEEELAAFAITDVSSQQFGKASLEAKQGNLASLPGQSEICCRSLS